MERHVPQGRATARNAARLATDLFEGRLAEVDGELRAAEERLRALVDSLGADGAHARRRQAIADARRSVSNHIERARLMKAEMEAYGRQISDTHTSMRPAIVVALVRARLGPRVQGGKMLEEVCVKLEETAALCASSASPGGRLDEPIACHPLHLARVADLSMRQKHVRSMGMTVPSILPCVEDRRGACTHHVLPVELRTLLLRLPAQLFFPDIDEATGGRLFERVAGDGAMDLPQFAEALSQALGLQHDLAQGGHFDKEAAAEDGDTESTSLATARITAALAATGWRRVAGEVVQAEFRRLKHGEALSREDFVLYWVTTLQPIGVLHGASAFPRGIASLWESPSILQIFLLSARESVSGQPVVSLRDVVRIFRTAGLLGFGGDRRAPYASDELSVAFVRAIDTAQPRRVDWGSPHPRREHGMSFAGFVELLRILVESHRDSFEGLVQRLAETYRAREDAATIQGRVGRVPMSCPVYEGQDANLLTPARHRALQRGLVKPPPPKSMDLSPVRSLHGRPRSAGVASARTGKMHDSWPAYALSALKGDEPRLDRYWKYVTRR